MRYFLQKMSKLVKSGSFFVFPSGNILEGTFPSRLSDVHLCVHHYFYLHIQKGGSNQEIKKEERDKNAKETTNEYC